MSDRGISEVIGFVLVFALIVGTIAVVFGTGFSGLDQARHAEQVNNVERAFHVLADNLDALTAGDVPSRATQLRLGGGSISMGETVSIVVRAENQSDPADNVTHSIQTEPIVFEDDAGTVIAYTSGAVLRAESGGAVMSREPHWLIRPDRTVIPLVNTGSAGSGIAGNSLVQIVTEHDARALGEPFGAGTAFGGSGDTLSVNVTVTSPRVSAWNRYFQDKGLDPIDADPAGNNVTYRFETDTLYVPRTTVQVTFER